jgi:hypothetical protein
MHIVCTLKGRQQEGGGGGLSGADFRRRLGRQREAQALEQKLEFRLGLRVSGQQQLTRISGRDAHVDHLHGGKFLERAACNDAINTFNRIILRYGIVALA